MYNKRKTLLNLLVSIGSQTITLILGLIVPRIIMTHYGSDTNGLTNTISQLFTYMALLESGIRAAARNKLYKPIKENDRKGISFWVSAASNYYKKTSRYYLIVVLIMAFVMPLILKTEVGYWTIWSYIFFEGLTSVTSFYYVNSWTCLLEALGENYITNSISLIVKFLMYGVKTVLALNGFNIALIQAGYFLISLIQLFIYDLYMRKHYGWIDYNAASKNAKLPDKNSYLISEIAWTIFSSTDMIVLSIFISTKLSSVYSTYNMVFTALNSLLIAIYSAINYQLGQSYVENIEKYKIKHDMFNSIFIGCMTILMSTAYLLILPFIKLYTNGVNDINYVNELLPFMFCLVQLLSWSRYVSGNLTGLAGYARQTSYVSLAEATINIFGSVILVNYFGIIGVIGATVIALPLKIIYCNWLADIKIIKRSPIKTIKILMINYCIFGSSVILNNFINLSITSYSSFLLYGILFFTMFSLVTILLNLVVNKDLLQAIKTLKI